MSYRCPKCNEIMYPNEDGTCPLCGAQTKDEMLLPAEEGPQAYENINKKLWDPKGFLWISVFFSFLSANVFSSSKVEIDLCDDDFKVLKVINEEY